MAIAFSIVGARGATTVVADPSSPSYGRPLGTVRVAPKLFVSQDMLDKIVILNDSGERIGLIDNPAGILATDSVGNLYVANYHDQSILKIFAPPYNAPPLAISFAKLGYVAGVAVDQRTGVFAVDTISVQPQGGPSSVSFFEPGTVRPCAVVAGPANMGRFGGAISFDRNGTLFFDYILNPNDDAIASISGECRPGAIQTYSPGIHYIGNLQFNTRNELVVQQAMLAGGPIYTFPHPQNGALGSPRRTTNLAKIQNQIPNMLTLTSDGKGVWASTFQHPDLALYRYPEGGNPIRVIVGLRNAGTGAMFPELIP